MVADVYDRSTGRMRPLNDVMEFDRVIRVETDGTVSRPQGISAPELFDGDLGTMPDQYGRTWVLLNGHSGQHGYSGPLMHQSEYIGGGMARAILEQAGLYVTLVNTLPDEEESENWAVAYCDDRRW